MNKLGCGFYFTLFFAGVIINAIFEWEGLGIIWLIVVFVICFDAFDSKTVSEAQKTVSEAQKLQNKRSGRTKTKHANHAFTTYTFKDFKEKYGDKEYWGSLVIAEPEQDGAGVQEASYSEIGSKLVIAEIGKHRLLFEIEYAEEMGRTTKTKREELERKERVINRIVQKLEDAKHLTMAPLVPDTIATNEQSAKETEYEMDGKQL